MKARVGIDSGGTFTDAVAVREDGSVRVAKVPSTPADPTVATIRAYDAVTAGDVGTELRHGTTVPTNSLLEGRGARTALVTTRGFRDVLEIGRQRRPDLYDVHANRPVPLVPEELRFEVDERVSASGEVLKPLDSGPLPARIGNVGSEAVAVCLLHAYANGSHEHRLAKEIEATGYVVCSSDVANEFREFERTSTTVLHAYLGPGTARYFAGLDAAEVLPEQLLVMRSSGGLGAAADLVGRPADALLSGPAAGALAAGAVAVDAGYPDAVGFDMGGTSTDVVLIRDGRPELRAVTDVAGYPCLAPALAVHTVGAGGGSIARIDVGGALRVGPQSAGADPGPAAYGRGGTQPTVTDANAVLGRVTSLIGGAMKVHIDAARAAVGELGADAAEAIVAVVEANMERALRAVTVQQGIDPAGLAIVAFGGAGGLHAAHLCRNLGARAAIVPPYAGLLSAVGLLAAPVRADRSRTILMDLDTFAVDMIRPLADEAARVVAWAGRPRVGMLADCRYRGQSHEITVDLESAWTPEQVAARFHVEHERVNGYRRPEAPVQVATIRAFAEVGAGIEIPEILAQEGHTLERGGLRMGETRPGPLLVTETEATTFVPEGFTVTVDERRNLVLEEP